MNPKQLEEFLSEPNLMIVATENPNGYPHLTPVWYKFENGFFYFSTTAERKKGRNLVKNKKVGFAVAPSELSYEAVVGYGDAEIIEDPKGELLIELGKKYLPAEKADNYTKGILEAEIGKAHRIIVKIKPKWLRSWSG